MMLLDLLSDHPTLEDAAKAFAGNWQNWPCFMWLGSDDIPNNHNVALGYLVNNHHPTVCQLANSELIKEKLESWMGEHCGEALVGPFSSSVSGDRNVLSGVQVRVYDDEGAITEPFKVLYELALKWYENPILDESKWNAINEQKTYDYIVNHLPFVCEDNDIPFVGSMVTECYTALNEDEVLDFDYIDNQVEEWVAEYVENKRRDEKNGLYPEHEDVAN